MPRFNLLFGILFVAGVAANAASDLSGLNVYPNPVRVFNGETTVTFNNLTDQVKIVILDVNGRKVREVSLESSGSIYVWDLKNDEGVSVASGVYPYIVSTSGGKRRGKLAVIR